MASWWQRLFGKKPEPPAIPAPVAPEPQHLGSEDEVFLAQLVADLADGKRRDEIGEPGRARRRSTGVWASGHERLAIEWMEKLLSVPEVPAASTAPLRAALVERYEQRGELDTAHPPPRAPDDRASRTRCARTTCSPSTRASGAITSARSATTRPCSAATSTTRTCACASSACASSPAAPRRSPARRSPAGDVAGVQAGARYRLVRELGRGATGVVYLARDAELERDVAVKLLHPHLAGTERADALARFFHEARVMASLRHPNVVAVLDLDEASRRIVMELAAGGTLRDVLRERGPRPLRRAIERHGQILSALAAAHRRGIVHCDLKPANLMFRRDVDLPGRRGHARRLRRRPPPRRERRSSARVGQRAEAVGTLAYMAPEQRRGELSPAADIYASAVVLFENAHRAHAVARAR